MWNFTFWSDISALLEIPYRLYEIPMISPAKSMIKVLKLARKRDSRIEKVLGTFMKVFGRYPIIVFRIENRVKYPISSFCAELEELTDIAL